MQVIPRIALVTGISSSIGIATVRKLISKGFKVACCDFSFIHNSPSESILRSIDGGSNALYCGMDVLNSGNVYSTLQTIRATFGYAPSVIVNTERLLLDDNILNTSQDPSEDPLGDLRDVLERNVVGSYNLARIAAREMASNPSSADGERGVIINRSSLAATNGSAVMIGYCASMGAISAMTLPLARHLGESGIRCVDIQAGFFSTAETQEYEDTVNVLSHMSPFPKRLGKPEEYADLVYSIITNPMINGCSIRLDGGVRF